MKGEVMGFNEVIEFNEEKCSKGWFNREEGDVIRKKKN